MTTNASDRGYTSRAARWFGWLSIAIVLAIAFAGYLHPDMRLDWAAIAQLCGLR